MRRYRTQKDYREGGIPEGVFQIGEWGGGEAGELTDY